MEKKEKRVKESQLY